MSAFFVGAAGFWGGVREGATHIKRPHPRARAHGVREQGAGDERREVHVAGEIRNTGGSQLEDADRELGGCCGIVIQAAQQAARAGDEYRRYGEVERPGLPHRVHDGHGGVWVPRAAEDRKARGDVGMSNEPFTEEALHYGVRAAPHEVRERDPPPTRPTGTAGPRPSQNPQGVQMRGKWDIRGPRWAAPEDLEEEWLAAGDVDQVGGLRGDTLDRWPPRPGTRAGSG
ncbi:hypothetical protein FB451DRAFT_1181463 [Mycena latifolia]|nr:hypothetical protein FB451DRAFT_1181463 [Mycena latifolia]